MAGTVCIADRGVIRRTGKSYLFPYGGRHFLLRVTSRLIPRLPYFFHFCNAAASSTHKTTKNRVAYARRGHLRRVEQQLGRRATNVRRTLRTLPIKTLRTERSHKADTVGKRRDGRQPARVTLKLARHKHLFSRRLCWLLWEEWAVTPLPSFCLPAPDKPARQ